MPHLACEVFLFQQRFPNNDMDCKLINIKTVLSRKMLKFIIFSNEHQTFRRMLSTKWKCTVCKTEWPLFSASVKVNGYNKLHLYSNCTWKPSTPHSHPLFSHSRFDCKYLTYLCVSMPRWRGIGVCTSRCSIDLVNWEMGWMHFSETQMANVMAKATSQPTCSVKSSNKGSGHSWGREIGPLIFLNVFLWTT